MEIGERLGEFMMVGFFGQEMDNSLAAHLRELKPAGLIFFTRNIANPEQLARLTKEAQSLAIQEFGRPLLLAIDQEGGTVARLALPFTQIPDAVSLGLGGCESVTQYYELAAKEMRQVGLNLNLAPVLDINTGGPGGLMEKRSFGRDPSLVARCGVAAIKAIQKHRIMATAKHFPGLGQAQKDPHYDLPLVNASRAEMEQHELLPFTAAGQAGVDCMMTSHTLYPALDPEFPATFSSVTLRDLLRDKIGFSGVVITDDLDMGAVTGRYSPEDAAIGALRAGADLLLVCNDMENMRLALEALHRGLDRGLLDTETLAVSLTRVEKLRDTYLRPLTLANPAKVASAFGKKAS
jgi:beta-N-acetylhexosaminidase